MLQAAWEMGAEAIILGEMSEFIVIASLEMGMPVIESLHSARKDSGNAGHRGPAGSFGCVDTGGRRR